VGGSYQYTGHTAFGPSHTPFPSVTAKGMNEPRGSGRSVESAPPLGKNVSFPTRLQAKSHSQLGERGLLHSKHFPEVAVHRKSKTQSDSSTVADCRQATLDSLASDHANVLNQRIVVAFCRVRTVTCPSPLRELEVVLTVGVHRVLRVLRVRNSWGSYRIRSIYYSGVKYIRIIVFMRPM
jgi:hypothetical protein